LWRIKRNYAERTRENAWHKGSTGPAKKKRKKSNNTMSGDNNFIQDEKGASREQGLYFVI